MAEFEDLDLNKDVEDMEEDEARKTLSEFMDAHDTNRTAYDELNTELDEVETEYQEKLEAREELISEFTEERAEEAAEHVHMPADVLADRFSLDELEQIIDEAAEFSEEESGEETEEEEDDSLTEFSDKPQKGQTEGGQSKYRDRAANALAQKGMNITGGN